VQHQDFALIGVGLSGVGVASTPWKLTTPARSFCPVARHLQHG
jgi:hypothetical protein